MLCLNSSIILSDLSWPRWVLCRRVSNLFILTLNELLTNEWPLNELSLLFLWFNHDLRLKRLFIHRKNWFAARCECLHLIKKNSQCLFAWCELFLIRCKYLLRTGFCDDWKVFPKLDIHGPNTKHVTLWGKEGRGGVGDNKHRHVEERLMKIYFWSVTENSVKYCLYK